jgi:hypothetical protein
MLSALGQQVIERSAASAVVCGEDLHAYGVSGGGAISAILTSDDLASFTPIGPNAQVRSARFGRSQQVALDALVTRRLAAAYRNGDPSVTSIAALYALAAQQATPETSVIFVTTGVNEDQVVNLNKPLRVGQGSTLAKLVQVPHVTGKQITIVGIAQVDASTPPPSPQWPKEVLSFNEALCRASGVSNCRLYDLASVSQVLGS